MTSKKSSPWWQRGLKRLMIATFAFSAFAFMLGFFVQYHLPRIKRWMLVEIEQLSAKHSPVRVWPKGVHLSWYPFGVTLEGVRLLPQGTLKDQLAPAEIDELSVSLSLSGLFKGRLRVGEIYIRGADIRYTLPADPSKPTPDITDTGKPIIDLNFIYDLPLDLIRLEKFHLTLTQKEPQMRVRAENLSLLVENSFRALLIEVDAPHLQIEQGADRRPILLALGSKVLARDNRLQLSALKVKKDDSYLVASGTLYGDVSTQNFSKAVMQAKTSIDLEDLHRTILEMAPTVSVPEMKGMARLGVDFRYEPGISPSAAMEIEGDEILIDGYEVGNLKAEGALREKDLLLSKVVVQQAAGEIRIHPLELNFGVESLWRGEEPTGLALRGKVDIQRLDLHRFFKSIQLQEIPVWLKLSAHLPCAGSVFPKLAIECSGELRGQDLKVTSGSAMRNKEAGSIVEIESFGATGAFRVTDQAVHYQANVKIQNSTGSTSGEIDFDKGFRIQYEGDIVDMKHFRNLANLQLEGAAKVKGSTSGDSHVAVMDLQLDARHFWLEDFGLGQVKTKVSYRAGHLDFKGMEGFFNTSRYMGDVNLDLLANTVSVTGSLPYLDLGDLTQLLKRNVPIPISLGGTGSAQVKVHGPLQLNQLSFQLESNIFRGAIAGENFDKLFIVASAQDGHVTTQRVEAIKGSSRVDFRGILTPQGTLDAVIIGRDLRLEQSEVLDSMGVKLTGQLDTTVALKGPLLHPDVRLTGRITKLILAEEPAEDSNFQLEINNRAMRFSGRFIGEAVSADLVYPLEKGQSFSLKAKTNNWNFTQLFNALSTNSAQRGYQADLTGELNLVSQSGDPLKSTGFLQINRFLLRRGPVYLKSPDQPLFIHMQQGEWRTKDFKLFGDSSFVELVARPSTWEKWDMNLNGKIDLALALFLVPFMEDLRGMFSMSLQMRGSSEKPQFLGSGFIQDGYVKLKAFPHAFERINSDMFIGQNGLVINTLKANLGGGDFRGDGRISFTGGPGVGVDISGNYDNVSLNIPDGFRTRGSGEIYFRGKDFPYELGGRYEVARADVDKDLSAAKQDTSTIQPSTYLPKFVGADVFEPIHLNLDIELMQPASVKMLVNNAKVETPVSGRLRVKQAPSSPILNGRLTTGTPGRITFRNNIFDIRSGTVEYRDSAADNPHLLVIAESRLRDEYDVTLRLQGTGQKPRLELTSQPPLPESELVSLLALGVTSRDLNNRNLDTRRVEGRPAGDAQAAQAGLELGSAIIRDQLGLNRGLPDRLGVEVDISQSFDDVNNTSVPAVTLRKQWSPKFGASASQTLGGVSSYNFRANYRFNKNLSVIGTFQNRAADQTNQGQQTTNENLQRYGLDLDYRIEFK